MSDSLLSNAASSEPFIESQSAQAESIPSNSFLDSLPEDIRGEASLKDFKDHSALAKSYVNAQRMLGGSVRIPGADASEEAKAEFYNKIANTPGLMRSPNPEDEASIRAVYEKLGCPSDPGQYKLAAPEGIELDRDQISDFSAKAHQLGLTQKQYEGVVASYIENEQQAALEFQQAREAGEQALKAMWGPEYNTRLEAAKIVSSAYAEKYPEAMHELMNGPAGNNPALVHLLSEMAPIFQERGVIGGQSKFQFGTSSDEAMEKIADINQNRQHAYWDQSNPEHSAAVERVNKLYEIAYPT